MAPTSIHSPRGKQIKTDRIDAAKLAQFYGNDLLTLVIVPLRTRTLAVKPKLCLSDLSLIHQRIDPPL